MNNSRAEQALHAANNGYNDLVFFGYKPEEARQVLPNAKAVNILWTINARSLINFLNLRLCKRNTKEMLTFANRVHELCNSWYYDLFSLIGPDCKIRDKCTQGHMKAGCCK